ncbi:MAG: hypothetical protein QM731_04130 [Chitinophagaceae bacterium]
MKQLYKAFFVLLSVAYSHTALAQSSIVPSVLNAAGGTYDNADSYYRFEWSIGEITLIDAFAPADSSLLVTQGVLQPCTDKVTKSPYIVTFDVGDIKLFPSPTTGKFEVDFFVHQSGRMELLLTDLTGKVLEKRSYYYNGCCRIEYFDVAKYPNGIYYVIATLTPDTPRPGDNLEVKRHGGYRILKMDSK